MSDGTLLVVLLVFAGLTAVPMVALLVWASTRQPAAPDEVPSEVPADATSEEEIVPPVPPGSGAFLAVLGLSLWSVGLVWPVSTTLSCHREADSVIICTEATERTLWTGETTERSERWTVKAWEAETRANHRRVSAGLTLKSADGASFHVEGLGGPIAAAAAAAEALLAGEGPPTWNYVSTHHQALIRWPLWAVGTVFMVAYIRRIWARRRAWR